MDSYAVVQYLYISASVVLPLSAVVVVLFPLLAGRESTVSVVVMETIQQAFAVFKFTQVVTTCTRWL